jgi:hypothetical protein
MSSAALIQTTLKALRRDLAEVNRAIAALEHLAPQPDGRGRYERTAEWRARMSRAVAASAARRRRARAGETP